MRLDKSWMQIIDITESLYEKGVIDYWICIYWSWGRKVNMKSLQKVQQYSISI